MWLVVISLVATVTTAIWYAKDNGEYKLSLLSLILWGTAIMVFVDHVMGYLGEGGEFLEMTTEATVLGIILVIVALVVWEVVLLLDDPKGKLKRLKV
jgi:hypothetical protein